MAWSSNWKPLYVQLIVYALYIMCGHVIFIVGDVSQTVHELTPQSLRVPFIMDHKHLLQIRSNNIAKWRKDHQWRQIYNEEGIDKRNNLSLEEFSQVYDGKWPVIITDIVRNWPAYNWTGDFLNRFYGQEQVVMKMVDQNLDRAISKWFVDTYQLSGEEPEPFDINDAVSINLPLSKFYHNIDKVNPNSWRYIEDELFIPLRPELRKDIGDNQYIKDDFFQIFPEYIRPWNAMLLWGTKYSRSPLHMDPYNWTATSTVITGRKWWKLYPPGQDRYLYIMKNKRCGFPLDCYKYNSVVDAFNPDFDKYPLFKNSSAIFVEQLSGEILFIPSGWFHQAYNKEETLAISSQVMNINNYRVILEEILKMENIERDKLPTNIDLMSPLYQVKTVMSMLPRQVLERGRKVTEDILYKRKLARKQTK